jgi:hypothetical protein
MAPSASISWMDGRQPTTASKSWKVIQQIPAYTSLKEWSKPQNPHHGKVQLPQHSNHGGKEATPATGRNAASTASEPWNECSKPSVQIMEEVQQTQHPNHGRRQEVQLPHNPHHGRSVATPASRSWKAHQTPAFSSREECRYPNITS